MISLGYGGDDIADYRKVNYVVADYGYAAANDDCKVASVTLADATAKLDLEGHTLTVGKFQFYNSDRGKLVSLAAGEYTAAALDSLGIAVVDSSELKSGVLRIAGQGLSVILR